jgi:hypothetical protein
MDRKWDLSLVALHVGILDAAAESPGQTSRRSELAGNEVGEPPVTDFAAAVDEESRAQSRIHLKVGHGHGRFLPTMNLREERRVVCAFHPPGTAASENPLASLIPSINTA